MSVALGPAEITAGMLEQPAPSLGLGAPRTAGWSCGWPTWPTLGQRGPFAVPQPLARDRLAPS